MPEQVTPAKVQIAVQRGFERINRYRKARAMFIKEFVGQYYQSTKGLTGDEPINLIFQTIRAWVPNLVMKNPINEVITRYTSQEPYAELLSLALDQVEQDLKLKQVLRGWVVGALFGLGIIKVGIAASGEMIQFGDKKIDPGQVYAELVDLDDFVMDPVCTSLSKSTFLGSRIRVPRQLLLDTDGYDHDLVKQLPLSKITTNEKIEDLSKRNTAVMEMYTLQDFVDVVELFVPEANALVTIPDPKQITFDNYLRLTDFNGPKEGPYKFLSFTPPVPNNPLPIAPVSLWYDLHKMANRMFQKTMDQADRQKDLLLYNPANPDDAQDILDAKDGDVIASSDPRSAAVYSYGGQNRSNEVMLQSLQVWYNYIAGNPDQMAGNMTQGTKGTKETATRSSILQANANISIEDARDILYDGAAEISQGIAWYLHTDPLINLPLMKRTTGGEQVQLWLTPEQRSGDFLKFVFRIVARSMSRLDPAIKSKRIVEFGTSLIPALINAAMVAIQMGVPFNVQKAITDIAKELDLTEHVQDWFNDPQFEQKMKIMLALGPQNAGKASTGSTATGQNSGGISVPKLMSPTQEVNQQSQMGAAESQSANQGAY